MERINTLKIDGKSYRLTESAFNLLKDYDNFIRKTISDKDKITDIEIQLSIILETGKMEENPLVELSQIEEAIRLIEENEHVGFKPSQKRITRRKNIKYKEPKPQRSKKLYRNRETGVLGGVCSGISEFSGIDAILIRIAFIVASVFIMPFIIIYILLWIFIPENKTGEKSGIINNRK